MYIEDLNLQVYNANLEWVGMVELGAGESFIWTERYFELGDFSLVGPVGKYNRDVLQPGNFVGHHYSNRLMVISEAVNQTINEQGAQLRVRGQSLEGFLNYRAVPPDYTPADNTIKTLTYGLLRRVLLPTSGANPLDALPGLSIPASGDGPIASVEFTEGSKLLDTIRDLIDQEDYGFRLVHNSNANTLSAEVYEGVERDIFLSPSTDSLSNESYLSSIQDYANVIHVSNDTHELFYGPGSTQGGFNRRLIHLKVNIETTNANYQTRLRRKAREELKKHSRKFIFDGEIDVTGLYVFGRDFGLGDILTIGDNFGNSNRVRVTEFIRSFDAQGHQAYPSFELVDEV